jgi:hypothetical protein
MAAEEVRCSACPFAGQKRANRIDQASARANQLRGDIEQTRLERYQSIQSLWR